MVPNPKFLFGIYCFIPSDCCLKTGATRLPLLPKDAAVLNCLLAKKGHLVTKDELLKEAWSGTAVSTSVLRSSIKRLRKILDDTYNTPRYIETVHGKGYRFVCEVKESPSPQSANKNSTLPVFLSGRKTELDDLGQLFKEAKEGKRRIAFVSGEAGIGKTTLVDGFVSGLFGSEDIGLARGNCVDQYGSEEEYLPFLEALNLLCRTLSKDRITSLLYQYAPMWLAQIPWLLENDEREKLQNMLIGTTPQRMLRELAEVLEVLSQELPLVLVLEDLHWSDTATVAAIDYLARRRNRAKIILLGTYRPLEVNYRQHPLGKMVAELKLHNDVTEFTLAPLSESALKTYLHHAFDGLSPPEKLIQWINHYSRGNPLFWRSLITRAQNRGWLKVVENQFIWNAPSIDSADRLVPDNLVGIIQHQIKQLSVENRSLLERASIMGATFHTAVLANDHRVEQEHSESGYHRIAQHEQLIKPVLQDSFPDAFPTRSYTFAHILYQRVIYEGIATLRRQRLHLEIGKRLEAIYGERTHEIAGALAMHFNRGEDAGKSARYRQQAADVSMSRHAYKEAINHAKQGLKQLGKLPQNSDRDILEIGFRMTIGTVSSIIKGYAASEVEDNYSRALTLSRDIGEISYDLRIFFTLWVFYLIRDRLEVAEEMAKRTLQLAHRTKDRSNLAKAHCMLLLSSLHQAQFLAAYDHGQKAESYYDRQLETKQVRIYGYETGSNALAHHAIVCWILGYPDQARENMLKALQIGRSFSQPFTLAGVIMVAAWGALTWGDPKETSNYASQLNRICSEHEFIHYLSHSLVFGGWARTMMGDKKGVDSISHGIENCEASGMIIGQNMFFSLKAEAYGKIGLFYEGLILIDKAIELVERYDEHWWEAEIYRIKGDLVSRQAKLMNDKSSLYKAAEVCFCKAIEIARKQHAKSFELRAASRLSQLWVEIGKRDQAVNLLSQIYGWFNEGFETKDLVEAKALLERIE